MFPSEDGVLQSKSRIRHDMFALHPKYIKKGNIEDPDHFVLPHCATLPFLSPWRVQYDDLKEVVWPSGPRRWIKAPVSSGAWVQIPPLPGFYHHHRQAKHEHGRTISEFKLCGGWAVNIQWWSCEVGRCPWGTMRRLNNQEKAPRAEETSCMKVRHLQEHTRVV